MQARRKGWLFIIGAIILSFIITLRDTIFGGQPVNKQNLIMMSIIAGTSRVSYAIATKVDKNKK